VSGRIQIRFALGTLVVSLCEEIALATGKPIGPLSGHLMREISKNADADAETADLCAFMGGVRESLTGCRGFG
jgi:hypothetical protein